MGLMKGGNGCATNDNQEDTMYIPNPPKVVHLPLAAALALPLLWAGMQSAAPTGDAAVSRHVYSIAQVQQGVAARPRAWLGRAVSVRAIAYGCWAVGGRDTANCRWRPGLVDRIGQTDALALTWAAQSPLLHVLRHLPVIGGLVPAAQVTHWDIPAIYRIRLQAGPCSVPGDHPCAEAVLLDALSSSA
jgi:hypothetical protein